MTTLSEEAARRTAQEMNGATGASSSSLHLPIQVGGFHETNFGALSDPGFELMFGSWNNMGMNI